jgi:tryptophan synthase alpha chain
LGRIEDAFDALRAHRRKGFIPFITAGDPDLNTTEELLVELSLAGATVIELGVPFSDPMADGPVIQRASERALKNRFGLTEVLEVVSAARRRISTPIILFSYFNPLLQFGIKRLAKAAAESGVDGILVTDLIPEEAGEVAAMFRAQRLDMIFLVAPTSTDVRLELIAKQATGFIYAVSRAGITGTQQTVSIEAEKLVGRVRKFSSLPVAVGFGISTSDQVAQVHKFADAVVVGSAIVQEIERVVGRPDVANHIGKFARPLVPQ